ncbi:hypothetical protein [Deinococcus kurensis]|uniref:hypothetical protein n=1 Tax=Deinococcus kurensis TaxID=2662757 RepID=UPI0012D32A91|nr:hypothetical protein [Deinococcus kurensis]
MNAADISRHLHLRATAPSANPAPRDVDDLHAMAAVGLHEHLTAAGVQFEAYLNTVDEGHDRGEDGQRILDMAAALAGPLATLALIPLAIAAKPNLGPALDGFDLTDTPFERDYDLGGVTRTSPDGTAAVNVRAAPDGDGEFSTDFRYATLSGWIVTVYHERREVYAVGLRMSAQTAYVPA